ncbi:general secretion pathway protein H [Rhizobium wenxiniae]|uniref:Type II secretion system protein H n=2 Tax=Rhizobium wenxiniae TaxID=1737357 RepID=A0A7X0D381_9HYPH|nr:general secretion pathway protein H [Rhizobium wenxiniae]
MIEMLVVLAIVGIMFSIALPSLRPHRSETPIQMAQKVFSLAQETRLAAIKSNEARSISVSVQDRSIVSQAREKPVEVPKELEFVVTFGRGNEEATENAKITFFPTGGSTGGRITFRQNGADKATVAFNWLTGAISLDQASSPK